MTSQKVYDSLNTSYNVEVQEQGDGSLRQVVSVAGGSLVPEAYDYIALTYVSAGNGTGEIETITYKTGGASGTTVATLTLAYNANDEVATITKT